MRKSLVVLLLIVPGLAASQLPASDVAAWREDLRVLATELPARHKNAFAHMTRAQWDSAVRRLDERIPRLARHEIIVELMRLVAMVRDGHTWLAPEMEGRIGFRRLPVMLYDFSDGLFVIAADSAHADLVGARVARIGRMTAAEAVTATTGIISHESANWARYRAASLLAVPEVLAALGATDDPAAATVVVQQGGRDRTVQLAGAGNAEGDSRYAPAAWVQARAVGGELPLWRQHPEAPFWFTILPDRTLYIGYRSVDFFYRELNENFFRRAFAAGDSARVERVVIDMRLNGGGNNYLNRFVVKEIIRRPALDRPDRLLVLIGRGVFSAAQNLVNELDYYTNATFVGEPTGNAPNQYGDARVLLLPHSQLRVRVSSLLWQGHVASDDRTWFTPDVYVETSSSDYFAGRDPVLATALRRATSPGLDRQVASDADRGDTAAVRRVVDQYRDNPENRYRDLEADVNAAGYRLLQSGQTVGAVTVMRVNTALFPQSANVYDSLGEALERSGRRDDAIAAFRRALELNPNQFSARDGLRRLGVSP